MAIRFYLVPKIGTGATPQDAFRPKYVADGGIAGVFQSLDYGQEDAFLVAAEVTPAEHTALAAQTDVIAVPSPIGDQVSAVALSVVQSRLESLNMPGAWVTTQHTYRQVLRAVAGFIRLMQRLNGSGGGRLFPVGITLDSRVNQLPVAVRQAFLAAAASLGLDTSAITGTMLIRVALKILADQLPPLTLGGETL